MAFLSAGVSMGRINSEVRRIVLHAGLGIEVIETSPRSCDALPRLAIRLMVIGMEPCTDCEPTGPTGKLPAPVASVKRIFLARGIAGSVTSQSSVTDSLVPTVTVEGVAVNEFNVS